MAKMYLPGDDPYSGIRHWVDTDEETGITAYGVDQDCTAILEANKYDQNADWGRWKDINHVARIPMVTVAALVAKGIVDHEGNVIDQEAVRKELKKVLNDSDYSKLRTRPGRI